MKNIENLIIKLLFTDNCPFINENGIKEEIKCYNINIEIAVKNINSLKLYPELTVSYKDAMLFICA